MQSPISREENLIAERRLKRTKRRNEKYRKSRSLSPGSKIEGLPTLPLVDAVPRISHEVLAGLMEDPHPEQFGKLCVVDCRYDFEYDGGCILNAIRFENKRQLIKMFFSDLQDDVIIVFHCEFSSERGPKVAAWFREHDRRMMGFEQYPNVSYPGTYVLDGGYKEFFSKHENLCGGGYVRMHDKKHKEKLPARMTQFREMMKGREGKGRESRYHNENMEMCVNYDVIGEDDEDALVPMALNF